MQRSTPRSEREPLRRIRRWVRRCAAPPALLVVTAPAVVAPAVVHAAEAAAPMQLRTSDGRTFVGQVVRDVPSHVLLRIGGVEARFERAEVAKLSPVPDVASELAARRAAMSDDNLEGRLKLAGEMFKADLLDAARWELVLLRSAVPEVGPQRDRVEALLGAVAARRVLRTPAATSDAVPASAPSATPEAASSASESSS